MQVAVAASPVRTEGGRRPPLSSLPYEAAGAALGWCLGLTSLLQRGDGFGHCGGSRACATATTDELPTALLPRRPNSRHAGFSRSALGGSRAGISSAPTPSHPNHEVLASKPVRSVPRRSVQDGRRLGWVPVAPGQPGRRLRESISSDARYADGSPHEPRQHHQKQNRRAHPGSLRVAQHPAPGCSPSQAPCPMLQALQRMCLSGTYRRLQPRASRLLVQVLAEVSFDGPTETPRGDAVRARPSSRW